MKKMLLATVLTLGSFLVFAGNESGGGGIIFGNKINPWFLENTKNVTYCVEMAPEFGNVSRERAIELIDDGFSFWKKTFTDYAGPNFEHGVNVKVKLATQTFSYQEVCSDEVDVKFQLGFLTDVQRSENSNYKQLLGLAARTSYDEIHLKGKGYIYLAPQSGAARPVSANMRSRPWEHNNNVALKLALYHEIGHLFGLQDDHYSDSSLMGARFVDEVTSANFAWLSSPPSPFGCNKDFAGSYQASYHTQTIPESVTILKSKSELNKTNELKEWLELPANYQLNYFAVNKKISFKIDGKDWGSIDLNNSASYKYDTIDAAISLYLTKKQQVFPRVPSDGFHNYIQLYHVTKSYVLKDQILRLANGKNLKVFMNFDQSCMPTVGTSLSNKVYIDIFGPI